MYESVSEHVYVCMRECVYVCVVLVQVCLWL